MTCLLTVKQVSEWLNMKPSTLYLWASQGKIPSRKFHGLIRFDPEEIKQWVDASRSISKPLPPIDHKPVQDVDSLIARAKREVYTSTCGKPDQDRATRKGDTHGSV
jgi:excisionase family DNA binding protein